MYVVSGTPVIAMSPAGERSRRETSWPSRQALAAPTPSAGATQPGIGGGLSCDEPGVGRGRDSGAGRPHVVSGALGARTGSPGCG
jgi:hypothetical protein